MEIIQLTENNAEQLGFGCMIKGNMMVRDPKPWRDENLSDLKAHLGKDVWGYAAVEDGKPAGHILLGTVEAMGAPLRISDPNVLIVQCTYLERKYKKKGNGRALVNAVKEAFPDRPGLLVLSTKVKMYMHYKLFEKLGFRLIYSEDMWRIGYLPIQKDNVTVEWFVPQLEWDYIKPFTLIRGGQCPFLLHTWDRQKEIANGFKRYAPVDVISWADAKAKDPNALPGLYLFGKQTPAKPMMRWQFKRVIRNAIRREEKKTFGAAAATGYGKRKGK